MMKKMLCYMISSVFLLVILNSCESESEEEAVAPPTLSELAGNFTGDSDLDFTIPGTNSPIEITSAKEFDGAAVVFTNAAENNLQITLEEAQLSIVGRPTVNVGGVFTFTIDNLRKTLRESGPTTNGFDVDSVGSVVLTVGGLGINLALRVAVATGTTATAGGVRLTTTANLTAAEATTLVQSFNSSARPETAPVDVEILLSVDNITDRTPATLSDLAAGQHDGDSRLNLDFASPSLIAVSPDTPVEDGARIAFTDVETENLVITVASASLTVTGETAVDVTDVAFTFTVSDVARTAVDVIGFVIGEEGSVDLTVGSGSAITGLALKVVDVTVSTSRGIALTANAELTVTQATAAIAAFSPSTAAPTAAVDVQIDLIVTEINPVTTP